MVRVLVLLFAIGAIVCEARLRSHSVRLGSNPGAAIKISKSAIDKVLQTSANLISAYAPKIPIPDATVPSLGSLNFQSKAVKITKLAPPQLTYELIPPSGLRGKLRINGVEITGQYAATRQLIAGSQTDNGQITFSADDALIQFNLELGEFDNGQPKVAGFQCNATLGKHASVKITSNENQNFVSDVVAKSAKLIRPGFEKYLCPVVEKFVKGQVNRLLAKLPNVIDVNPNVAVKFRVKPVVTKDFLEVQGFAKCITDQVSSHYPEPFAEVSNGDSQVVLLVSDAVINDMAYQFYANHLLDYSINKNSHEALYDLIRLKCKNNDTACLGNIAPHLADKLGADADVEVVVKAVKAPVITFANGKSTFTSASSADLYATSQGKRVHDCNIQVEATGGFQVKLLNGEAYGRVSVEDVKVKIDLAESQKWEDKIKITIKKVIEEYINKDLLLKGIPLHLPYGIGLDEPLINFASHTLQIQTGFSYDANSAEKTALNDDDKKR